MLTIGGGAQIITAAHRDL